MKGSVMDAMSEAVEGAECMLYGVVRAAVFFCRLVAFTGLILTFKDAAVQCVQGVRQLPARGELRHAAEVS